MELPDKTFHRKDVNEGTKAVVKGYADDKHRQVLIELIFQVPLKLGANKTATKTIVEKTFPRNLQLSQKYDDAKESEALAKAAQELEDKVPNPADASSPASNAHKWLAEHLNASDHTDVRVEKNWDKFLSEDDILQRIFTLKSKVGVGLHAIYKSLPQVYAQGPRGLPPPEPQMRVDN